MVKYVLCWSAAVVFCSLLFVTAEGARKEGAALPDPFVVSTHSGEQLKGSAVRIEIRFTSVEAMPSIEIFASAANDKNHSWAFHSIAGNEFIRTLTLNAEVLGDKPLKTNQASIQVQEPSGKVFTAHSGIIKLKVNKGQVSGEANSPESLFSARFEGPVAVTCAVPEVSEINSPNPFSTTQASTLVVDHFFNSTLCKPYKNLVD